MARGRPRTLPRGIRRTPYGYQANVGMMGRTKWKRFHFPPEVTEDQAIEQIQQWRASEKTPTLLLSQKSDIPSEPSAETLGGAIATYLPAKRAMPSYADRVRELNAWLSSLGANTPRASITRVQIQVQRDAWVMAGKSASWINNRLTALSNLWTVLDGRRAPNPAREVPLVDRPDPEPRGLPYALIEQILQAIPERSRRVKGQTYTDDLGASKTKARLAVIAYTGLAHIQIKRLEPHDVNWQAGWVFVRSRRKGAPGRPKGRVKPLTPEGLTALRRFAEIDAWGSFSNSSMHKTFRRACLALFRKAAIKKRWAKFGIDLRRLRPYDLRHSYGSAMLAGTGNLVETQQLMAHADVRTTMRYALAAVPQHLASAIQRVNFRGNFRVRQVGSNLPVAKRRTKQR